MAELPKALQRPKRFASSVAPPYHPAFIEKLLLAIIDADPSLKGLPRHEQLRKREIRLRAAIEALLGYSTEGRSQQFDLELLVEAWLNEIDQQAFHNVVPETFPAPVARNLLTEAKKEKRANGEFPSTLGVLIKKYRKYDAYFKTAIGFHSPGIPEKDEIFADLKRIEKIFRKYNIGLTINCIELGLVSVRDTNIRRRLNAASD